MTLKNPLADKRVRAQAICLIREAELEIETVQSPAGGAARPSDVRNCATRCGSHATGCVQTMSAHAQQQAILLDTTPV
jgi:hypothetical protein